MHARKVILIRNGEENDRYRVVIGGGEAEGVPGGSNLSALEELLARQQPNVIVLDLEIPIRGGVELLRVATMACPEAEIMTRVRSRHLDPIFFSVRSSSAGLSLEPLGLEEQGRLSFTFGPSELAV